MPHIRKTNRIGTQLRNETIEKFINKYKIDKIISKVDRTNQRGIIKFERQNEEGKNGNVGDEGRNVTVLDSNEFEERVIRSVYGNKYDEKNSSSQGSEVSSSKNSNEDCFDKKTSDNDKRENVNDRKNAVENIKKCSVDSSVRLTSSNAVEHHPQKDKKVKFAESPSKSGDVVRKHQYGHNKSEKYKYYSHYKPETKNFHISHTPDLYGPQVGEIAVVTDLVPDDPISACLPCLEANGTYICTPCNPRCFIIQKVFLIEISCFKHV
ncbi:hypothetical protein Phum_PHUM582390 [Pediculus humanus corporis]|uniref:Uncharacterized protein n=1 Tax=Pediculus humanus subsp. corporis TaxID=121224 RepID=E0W1T2_PEDHC|nr:uncharacterized protein Phum_PHUM582390 [Pediculus humanus corporis]EEB19664.1 hypothetical protein Phum_PHUM582390 [Pediculus humanus corporis]